MATCRYGILPEVCGVNATEGAGALTLPDACAARDDSHICNLVGDKAERLVGRSGGSRAALFPA
jgi:hypothetical protein